MEISDQQDLIIVGGGAAGLRAAIAAAENYPELRIALLSKVYPVRSHTVSAEGGLAGVLREGDNLDQHAFDTIKGSDYLADQDAVEFFVKEAPKEIAQLEQWGCPWSREENGEVAVRAFGGMSAKRTVYAADKTGFYLLHSLFERSLKYGSIVRYDEWFVIDLIVDEGRVKGVVALSQRTGEIHAFQAKAVILATGGAGRLFRFTTNGGIKTGDGMALALRAGAQLKDMEFVQFHPTGLVRTGILITEAARGEGGYLVNKNGERFLKNYLPTKMELGPRDIISRAIMSEIQAGRGIETQDGACVHLDLRHLGEKLIDERLPLVREISQDYQGVDPVEEPIPVRPVLHYFMGGIHTDLQTRTSLAGLYAAGETACVTINGANRLGSNSLSECLVFGRVAGERAGAEALRGDKEATVPTSALKSMTAHIEFLRNARGKERVPELRRQMQETLEESAGILREEKSLCQGLDKVRALKERYRNLGISDRGKVFNTELIQAIELGHMMEAAEVVLQAALERRESRGSHTRTDFAERNDNAFLHHQVVYKEEQEKLHWDKMPVTITRWQPQARIY